MLTTKYCIFGLLNLKNVKTHRIVIYKNLKLTRNYCDILTKRRFDLRDAPPTVWQVWRGSALRVLFAGCSFFSDGYYISGPDYCRLSIYVRNIIFNSVFYSVRFLLLFLSGICIVIIALCLIFNL